MGDTEPAVRTVDERATSEITRRLERTIASNRFTIAVVFPVVGAAMLIASAEGWLPPWLAFHAGVLLVGTVVMRSPLLVGVAPLLDRRAAVVLLGLIGYTYAIELIGVTTDLPYGAFTYTVALGPMFAGVPLALPLLFIPLVINAYLLVVLAMPALARSRWFRVTTAIVTVIAIDAILDPAAVAIGFWSFESGGLYYGVPVSNYLGWLLSGTVAVIAVELALPVDELRGRASDCPFILDDLVSFVLLWGTINLRYGQVVPVLVTGVLLIGLVAAGRWYPLGGSSWTRRLGG